MARVCYHCAYETKVGDVYEVDDGNWACPRCGDWNGLGVVASWDVTSDNNGGSTDYYKFGPKWKECADIIEARAMNYNQGNIFKSAFCFNTGRHDGTTPERELNKIIYFAQRELDRMKEDE